MNEDQPNPNPWMKSLLVWGGIFLALFFAVAAAMMLALLGVITGIIGNTPDQVAAIVKKTQDDLGSLDILVNNAGIVNDSFLMMMSDNYLEQTLGVNLKSCFYCCSYLCHVWPPF